MVSFPFVTLLSSRPDLWVSVSVFVFYFLYNTTDLGCCSSVLGKGATPTHYRLTKNGIFLQISVHNFHFFSMLGLIIGGKSLGLSDLGFWIVNLWNMMGYC